MFIDKVKDLKKVDSFVNCVMQKYKISTYNLYCSSNFFCDVYRNPDCITIYLVSSEFNDDLVDVLVDEFIDYEDDYYSIIPMCGKEFVHRLNRVVMFSSH